MIAKPVVKWAGGKKSLLPEILPRLPAKIDAYYEPFIGGGAVFFALAAEKRFECATIGDANSELAGMYRTLAQRPEVVIEALQQLKTKHSKTFFYALRARNPHDLTPPDRAARLIYLNKTCFNGLYRVNRKGGFNVPFGDYKNPTICDEEALHAAAKALSKVSVLDFDFEETVRTAKRGDAVYFDCPYWPVSKTASFTAYAKGGFGPDDQKRLRDCALHLKRRGVHVLLSNSDVPSVRALYADVFKIERVVAARRINSDATRRGLVGELLIT